MHAASSTTTTMFETTPPLSNSHCLLFLVFQCIHSCQKKIETFFIPRQMFVVCGNRESWRKPGAHMVKIGKRDLMSDSQGNMAGPGPA